MKTPIYTLFSRILIVSLLFSLSHCTKDKDVAPDLVDPTDAKKVGSALIVPDGTQTKDGTPPAPSTNAQAPKVTQTTTEQPTSNGNTETIPVRYSNLNGGIGGAYAQVEGASNYYDIPVGGNAPASGTLNIPIGIPENFRSGTFTLVYCIYDRSGRVSNILRIRFTITRVEPLKPGEGRANIGGRSVTATAVCDLNFGQFGRGYGIQMSNGGVIVLYNMKQGSNQLGNLESLIDNNPTGNITAPFGFYSDGANAYWSVSGSATASGKKVSASGTFKNILGNNQQISISASGNCQ